MKRSYVLAPEDRADESMHRVFAFLLRAIRANITGVLEDSDPEFLHDLRVATRRTRTALTQIKGVLPPTVRETYAPEFKWLGRVTGPLRDLDVHLIALAASRRVSKVDPEMLDALQNFLEDARRSESSRVSAAIRSARFQSLIEGWSEFVESEFGHDHEPVSASAPIIDVAAPRIFKAYRRIRNHGADADADSPAAQLHRLRIDGKKLRYLLEFFADLFAENIVERFISELKQLQDILGDFNDTEVQLTHIIRFDDQPTDPKMDSWEFRAGTRRLAEIIRQRQLDLRTEFVDRFTTFSSAENLRLYKETFKHS
jgi:CHAD domain-containing protein